MAKDKISDYSSTANSNTDIAGINIDEGCAPSGINDAIRTLMAQLKTWQSGGQDVYIHPAGSASAPSITANGDTNTGIFFPAADTVGITTGGTERARVDSAGNLGLGVTPSAWSGFSYVLQQRGGSHVVGDTGAFMQIGANNYYNGTNWIYTTTAPASRFVQNNGLFQWFNAASGTAGNAITFTQAMTLDASGNLAVGTTNTTYAKANIKATGSQVYSGLALFSNDGTESFIGLGCTGSKAGISVTYGASGSYLPLVFDVGGSERARIDTSGNLLVGTTSSSNTSGTGHKFSADGRYAIVAPSTTADTFNYYNSTAGAFRFYVTAGGTIFATSTTISAISDERLKENIQDIDTGLDAVMALKPRRFDWKEGKGQDKKNAAGFIAQEFETVFPDSVGVSKAGEDGIEYKNICHEELIPTLVKALQEMKAIVDAQAARITALEQA
jgi:hypothetical protein